jgi:hypothetical protein
LTDAFNQEILQYEAIRCLELIEEHPEAYALPMWGVQFPSQVAEREVLGSEQSDDVQHLNGYGLREARGIT